jgi:hypothetical protein
MEFTGALLATMRKMQQLDERRPRARFWWPKVPLIPIFGKRPRGSEFVAEDAGSQEEDPEQGVSRCAARRSCGPYTVPLRQGPTMIANLNMPTSVRQSAVIRTFNHTATPGWTRCDT